MCHFNFLTLQLQLIVSLTSRALFKQNFPVHICIWSNFCIDSICWQLILKRPSLILVMYDKVIVPSIHDLIIVHKAVIYMNNHPPLPLLPLPKKAFFICKKNLNFGLNDSLSSKTPASTRSHVTFARLLLLLMTPSVSFYQNEFERKIKECIWWAKHYFGNWVFGVSSWMWADVRTEATERRAAALAACVSTFIPSSSFQEFITLQ